MAEMKPCEACGIALEASCKCRNHAMGEPIWYCRPCYNEIAADAYELKAKRPEKYWLSATIHVSLHGRPIHWAQTKV